MRRKKERRGRIIHTVVGVAFGRKEEIKKNYASKMLH